MERADYILSGDYIVTMDFGDDAQGASGVINDGAVAVKGDRIIAVGAASDIAKRYDAPVKLGGKGRAVMPGLYNAHTHAAMSLMRGLADDQPLSKWLEEHIWPAENTWMSADFVRDGVRLACIEMIRSGTVAFCDMYFFDDVAGEAAREMGVRSVICSGIIDFPTKTTTGPDDCLRKAERLIEKFKGDSMVRPAVGAHTPYTCCTDTLLKSAALTRKHGVPLNIHLSETRWEVGEITTRYGDTPVRYLDKIGILDDNLIAAHCVWLDEGEIDLLAKRRVKVTHCIESNLKLASGIAPVPAMLKAGVSVSIGTDGAASNNDLDMFGELATVAKVHKAVSLDPTVVSSKDVLRMATVEGAKALGINGGILRPGMAADIIVIDLRKPHLTPVYNILSHLAYSAKGSDVESVMINGSLVMREGRVSVADEAEILARAAYWGECLKGNACGHD